MKTSFKMRPLFLLSILVMLLSSCESWFDADTDKDAMYRYQIKNETISPALVTVSVKEGTNVIVKGSPATSYTIAPGDVAEVWTTSGFTDDEVRDEEKANSEIYWIEVTATSNGRQARYNLNSTTRWSYNKQNSYKATYTLTLAEQDF
ncbi:hypothetical protein [Pontibacter rugosus]|uniref:Uncharacterized protein n=1 Tax=Pontibacter rugosus TaxID=1745966 RepID=A0ABW3SWA0_9BACT